MVDPMADPLLVVDRVTRRFGGLLAVNGASLTAQRDVSRP